MALSLKQFIDRLDSVGLVSAEEVARVVGALPPSEKPDDVPALAKVLIAAGRLTKYQAQAVYQEKTKHLVIGPYVVVDRIGAGGMGQVLKAVHRKMDREVALKILPPAKVNSAEAIKRFHQEVRAAAKLLHPNIVAAYDAGEHEGMHYLVMEYVDGQDLSSIVREQGRLPIEQAVDYMVQAANGLGFAHEKGIVHRDVKPGNLLLSKDGVIKILDMGLARLTGEGLNKDGAGAGEGLTQTGQVMGTIDYMAPEQALDTRRADHRADIYALGCTLYRLVTGETPFAGDTLMLKLLAHREQPVPSLREYRPDVSPALDAVYQRMMAKNPDDRQQSMAEVAAQLQSALVARAAPAPVRPVAAAAPPHQPEKPSMDSALSAFLQGGSQPAALSAASVPAPIQGSTSPYEETISHASSEEGTGDNLQPVESLAAGPSGSPGSAPVFATGVSTRQAPSRQRHAHDRKPWPIPAIAGGAIGAVILVALIVALALRGGDEPQLAGVDSPGTAAMANTSTEPAPIDRADPVQNSTSPVSSNATKSATPNTVVGDTEPAVPLVSPGPGWTALSNGSDLSGWEIMQTAGSSSQDQSVHRRGSGGWEVRGGSIVCTNAVPGWLKTAREYGDFELQMDFLLPADGNSGVYIRTPDAGHLSKVGMEVQILDDAGRASNEPTGSIRDATTATTNAVKRAGQWNHMEILCEGDDVRVTLNGIPVTQANMATNTALRDRPRRGYIGLANWMGKAQGVEFRNILIKELVTAQPSPTPVTAANDASGPQVAPLAGNPWPGEMAPWPSPDGLRLYFEGAHTANPNRSGILMVGRNSLDAPFGPPQWIADARMPCLTGDELELVCLGHGLPAPILYARRTARDASFPTPQPIAELQQAISPKSPFITSDGLTIIYNDSAQGFFYSHRASRTAPWTTPKPLPGFNETDRGRSPTWACLANDKMSLWYCHGGDRTAEIWVAKRPSATGAFTEFLPVTVDGQTLVGRSPRPCEASGELFFSRPVGDNDWEIVAAKGFRTAQLPPVAAPAVGNDWIDLFNGRDLAGWDGDPKVWSVEEGAITGRTASQNPIKENTFLIWRGGELGDFELQVQFHIEDGNSGIQIRSKESANWAMSGYQADIDAQKTEFHGLYEEKGRGWLARPQSAVGQAIKLGQWNDYYIIAHGNRIIQKINGVTTVDFTDDDPANAAPTGLLGLQVHGGPPMTVHFKHIRLRKLDSAAVSKVSSNVPGGNGWTDLFNGQDLTGWNEIGTSGGWTARNGELVAAGKAQGARQAGWLMTEREFADFELQLEFALAERTDSGVAVRCDPTQTTGTSQAEIQIVDQADASFIATYDRLPFARTGALSGLAASTTLPAVEHNTWHTVTISCIGRRLKATVDNVMTVDTNLDDHGGKEQAAGRAGIKRTAGPIGLQRLQGKIRYRNIRIRALGGAASNSPVPADAVVFGGHAYRFFDERLSWKDAQARCRALGGNLAVVESLEENTFVGALVAKGGRLDVWLGITDEAREGTWVTVSGQPVTYTNWWNGQPNNKQNEEHYAVLSNQRVGGVPMDWKWSDQPNVPHQIHQPGFVCEWDTIPTNGSGAVRGGGFGGGGGVKGGGGFGVGGGTRSPANDGWNDLFNGRNLTGWREFVTNGQWTVNNGAIATSGGTGSGWLATEKEYTDFELELEYKQPPGGNSGVFLRIPDTGIATGGQFLEVQLLQDSSKVLPYQRTGALYRVAAAPFVVDTPADTWHKLRVRAAGPVVTTWINDRQVVSGNVATAGATTADGGAPMPHVKRRSGRIGLQRHGTPGEFRNLRIKEL